MVDRSTVPVFKFWGGLGASLKEEPRSRPEPMTLIGEQSIVSCSMRTFSRFEIRKFERCLGFKTMVVRSYTTNLWLLKSAFMKSRTFTVVESTQL